MHLPLHSVPPLSPYLRVDYLRYLPTHIDKAALRHAHLTRTKKGDKGRESATI